MPSKHVPTYRKHKPSGLAVVTLPAVNGSPRRAVYLGPFGSPESHEAYQRVLAEWQSASASTAAAGNTLTIVELAVAFIEHARTYYRKNDEETSEVAAIMHALRFVHKLYGRTPAVDFGPLRLKACRDSMVAAGLARTTINQHASRIKRMFAWAVENEIGGKTGNPGVPLLTHVHHALSAVKGLRKGRSEARETDPILPAPVEHVEALRDHVSPTIWAMIQVQLHSGMRPAEVCALRTSEIETSGKVWFYRPAGHKTAHHGKSRIVPLGPRAQAILRPMLRHDLGAFVFSPLADLEAVLVNGDRSRRGIRVEDRERPPGERYTTEAYRRAISRACRRAGVPHFAPNQLRHTKGTELRRDEGMEAAQLYLGHSKMDTTAIYAERDLGRLEALALKYG